MCLLPSLPSHLYDSHMVVWHFNWYYIFSFFVFVLTKLTLLLYVTYTGIFTHHDFSCDRVLYFLGHWWKGVHNKTGLAPPHHPSKIKQSLGNNSVKQCSFYGVPHTIFSLLFTANVLVYRCMCVKNTSCFSVVVVTRKYTTIIKILFYQHEGVLNSRLSVVVNFYFFPGFGTVLFLATEFQATQ